MDAVAGAAGASGAASGNPLADSLPQARGGKRARTGAVLHGLSWLFCLGGHGGGREILLLLACEVVVLVGISRRAGVVVDQGAHFLAVDGYIESTYR